MLRPGVWGTLAEILAIACLLQVPVYECEQQGMSYHWEVHHPLAPSDQFKPVEITDNEPLQVIVANHRAQHFELLHQDNQHYDCIISKETEEVCLEPPVIQPKHEYVDLTAV